MTKTRPRSLVSLALVPVVFGLFTGVVGCGSEPESEPDPEAVSASASLVSGTALFVVGNTTLSTADQAARNRLTGAGLTVVVKRDSAAATGDATGKRLVVISSTVNSLAVAEKFRTVPVPVVLWESALFDDMAMTGARSGIDFGTVTNQRRVVIAVMSGDPMAAQLSGTQSVVSGASVFSWAKPPASANVVARNEADASRAHIFRYDKGTSMAGLAAPERRVGLFLDDATAGLLTDAGRKLFDAAVLWAAHEIGDCSPGAARCTGNARQVCNASGQWGAPMTCPSTCSGAGVCSGVCTPGASRCTGKAVETCDSTGVWRTTSMCLFVCASGMCTGECVPGTRQCVMGGGASRACNMAGYWQDGGCDRSCGGMACAGICATMPDIYCVRTELDVAPPFYGFCDVRPIGYACKPPLMGVCDDTTTFVYRNNGQGVYARDNTYFICAGHGSRNWRELTVD